MRTRLLAALFAALLLLRLPSLVQPMGADQGLYAYVGDRIRHGELAYRDAWDQKPPGIHYVYAALRALSTSDAVVPAADLASAALTAALLWVLGARLGGPAAGALSAVLFLALSDPSFARYGGVRIRAQCETFIALAVTGALVLVTGRRSVPRLIAAGLLLGAVFALKYNAGLFAIVALAAAALTIGVGLRDAAWLAVGSSVVPAALLLVFWRGGALNDLYQATITYNLQYSGETYASRWDMLGYLVRFPFERARLDGLWLAGGLGCGVLLAAARARRAAWVPIVWVAAACLSIAINGSRNLPQYFLQASPALGLAAGMGAAIAFKPLAPALRAGVAVLLAIAVWRAGPDPFPDLARNVWHDARYMFGRIDRRTHLARFGGTRSGEKFSALDNIDLGAYLASRTGPDEPVYVFGFSPGAYAYAQRRSASRFFWSRPVIVRFNAQDPRYAVAGLADELRSRPPAYVVLQKRDWAPDVPDSAGFFVAQPALVAWLRDEYHQVPDAVEGFLTWERNGR
ncbi:MAG TPA: hypothetical protein VFK57_12170 [Vicinamibacterales bacterium]|nr:hypothetical protein [Vicinamibacterales bacterium]